MKGITRLKKGDFNTLNAECLPDGSQIITITGGKDNKIHRLHIKDLENGKRKVYSDEEIK